MYKYINYIQHTDHVAAATSSVHHVSRKRLKQLKQSVLAFRYVLDLFNFGLKLPAISPSESGFGSLENSNLFKIKWPVMVLEEICEKKKEQE